MTVPANAERNDYTGNNSTNVYGYDFRIIDQAHLLVTVADSLGNETTLTIGTDYTVDGVGVKTGGDVTLVDNGQAWIDGDGYLDTGWDMTIRHYVSLAQSADIRNQGVYYPETIEDALDYLMWVDKQQQDELDRCIKTGETDSEPATVESIITAAETAQEAAEDARDAAQNYAAALQSTSTSSIAIGLGALTFVTQADKQFAAGQYVLIVDAADAGNFIYASVTSYTTTSLVVNSLAVGGTGTKADWKIYISGIRGATGAAGAPGAGTGDVLAPATNTDLYVPRWNGTDSKTLSDGLAVGTSANNLVQMTAAAKLPAVDGSLLTGISKVLQQVLVSTGAVTTVTTQIPFDDTIPQISEGGAVSDLDCEITPISASSYLDVEAVLQLSGSNAGSNNYVIAAMFRDSTAGAIAATMRDATSTGRPNTVVMKVRVASGSTSATTFKVRIGSADGVTHARINSDGTATRIFGGVCLSSVTVTEIL